MSVRRGRFLFILGVAVFGAIVFMLASSWVIELELPKWLAAAAGGLAFPVGPVLWQLVGERRRRIRLVAAKRPPQATLDPGDRYVLRAVVVAAVVLGPMFAIGRSDVLHAVWQHRTWFLPEPGIGAGPARSALLARVPGDAEAVLLVIGDHIPALNTRTEPGLFAYGDHQLLVIATREAGDVEPIDAKVAQMNQLRGQLPMLAIDPVVQVSDTDGVVTMTGERWKTAASQPGSGPGAGLTRELDRAPAAATVMAAAVPRVPVLGIERAAGWMVFEGDRQSGKVVIDARVEAVSEAAAETLLQNVRTMWSSGRSAVPASCRDQVEAAVSAIQVERRGAVFTVHLALEPDKLIGLGVCALGVVRH